MQKLKLIFLSFFLSLNLLSFEEFLVSDIRIIGLQRVSTGSIFNVIPISVGDRIDSRKSYTSRTVNTSCHLSFYQWSHIFFRNCSFIFFKS